MCGEKYGEECEKMLFAIAYTLTEYLNVYLAYRIILNAKLQKKIWVYIATLAVPCVLQIIFLNRTDFDWPDIIIGGTGFFVMAIWLENDRLKYVLLFPIVYIGTSVVNIFGSYLCSFFINVTEFKIINTPVYILLSEYTAILIMLCIGHWKKKWRTLQGEHTVTVKQYIILLVGLLNFLAIIGITQVWEYKDHISLNERRVFGFSEVMVAILFIVLNIWQHITLMHEQEYRQKNDTYENYIKLQEEHIRMLIDKDEDMRRFRHDFHAHITALEAYAEKIQDAGLQNYIEDMREASALYSVKKYTGITAVDAVISEIICQIREQKIELNWEGTLYAYEKVSLFDLCTIFSNLLLNSVEACEKQSNEKRDIYVKTYCYEGKLYLDIKNPIQDCMYDEKVSKIVTTKSDKKNHGFGIRNVKDTVNKYGGSIEYGIKSGWFEVEILI